MIDRINALGQYLVEKLGKPFNFKQIKGDHMYLLRMTVRSFVKIRRLRSITL